MWQSLKIGAAVVGITALAMSGLAVAHAVDPTDRADPPGGGPEAVINEALAPLVRDGTLTEVQVRAVADRLVPIVARARFQEQTRRLAGRLNRLGGEIAEVLGIPPHELGEGLQAGQTLAEIAATRGWTGDELVDRVTEHIAAHLSVRVTAGKLDQARADEVVASTGRMLGELIDVVHPVRSVFEERRERAARVAALRSAAGVLGLPPDEVRTRLESGSSLAAIAAEEGVTEEELFEAILAPIRERILLAVDLDRITDDRAAELLEGASMRVSKSITEAPGE